MRKQVIKLSEAAQSALECAGLDEVEPGEDDLDWGLWLLNENLDLVAGTLRLPDDLSHLGLMASAACYLSNVEDHQALHGADAEMRRQARSASSALSTLHGKLLRAAQDDRDGEE